MSLRTCVLAALVSATIGCMPSYKYGTAPVAATAAASPAEQCYRQGRVELTASRGSWRYTESTGSYIVGSTVFHTTRTRHFSAAGITAFSGGKRFSPVESLRLVGDAELERLYKQDLDATATGATMYPVMRNAAFGLAFGGLGITVLAIPLALQESDATLPVALLGAGVAVLSVIPTIFAALYYDDAIAHDLAHNMLVNPAYVTRYAAGARNYNRSVAQRCGHPQADLPMTGQVRSIIERERPAP